MVTLLIPEPAQFRVSVEPAAVVAWVLDPRSGLPIVGQRIGSRKRGDHGQNEASLVNLCKHFEFFVLLIISLRNFRPYKCRFLQVARFLMLIFVSGPFLKPIKRLN